MICSFSASLDPRLVGRLSSQARYSSCKVVSGNRAGGAGDRGAGIYFGSAANAIPTAVRTPSPYRDTVFLIGIVYVIFAVLLP